MQNFINMADTKNTIAEELLAKQLNLPIKKIRAMRPPDQAGTEWTLDAALALARELGLEFIPPASEDPEEELVVASIARGSDGRHFPNPRVIHARRSNGELVVVKVTSSVNYRPTQRVSGEPMVFKAKKSAFDNCWVPTGRAPRWPGQW